MVIGTLNEGSLHHELKKHYATKDTLKSGVAARFEVPLEGFVVDIVLSDHRIIEIQTGSFGAMKRKMQRLLDNHQMTLVYPIAVNRRLIRVTETGEVSRRSPKQTDSCAFYHSVMLSFCCADSRHRNLYLPPTWQPGTHSQTP